MSFFYRYSFLFGIISLSVCCNDIKMPKPKGYLSLDFSKPEYYKINEPCGYSFEMNKKALWESQIKKCWNSIRYPDMKATLYISYVKVNNNIDSLLNDAYQMPSKHINKAIEIPEKVFSNSNKKVFGTLFRVVGNAASQLQFFLTDSTDNFLVGSLYFYSRPNYDSIMPAARYIEEDVIRLIESFEWR
jgi:gliding motility-associated lipoprotein GldD|tara:strand:- start:311 stop:874 length:564 start_codon:yes stop_codon:yes gene_type:complete